jgi:hypothetical protein
MSDGSPIDRRTFLRRTLASSAVAGSSYTATDSAAARENPRLRWYFETGGGLANSNPAVVNRTVYVGSTDQNVYALDATEGTERWRFRTGYWVGGGPAVADGAVYACSADQNVYALDAADGTKRRRFQTDNAISLL